MNFWAVNDAGVQVGFLSTEPGFEDFSNRARAVKVAQDVVTLLDTRPAGPGAYPRGDPTTRLSEAYAINEAGVVVGRMAVQPDGPKHAFRHVGEGMQDLGTLGVWRAKRSRSMTPD